MTQSVTARAIRAPVGLERTLDGFQVSRLLLVAVLGTDLGTGRAEIAANNSDVAEQGGRLNVDDLQV
jgi:hypothetical protein